MKTLYHGEWVTLYHGGPERRVTKESPGFDVRAYRETPFTSDDARFFRRWGESVRDEFRRAKRHREFFHFYRPEDQSE